MGLENRVASRRRLERPGQVRSDVTVERRRQLRRGNAREQHLREGVRQRQEQDHRAAQGLVCAGGADGTAGVVTQLPESASRCSPKGEESWVISVRMSARTSSGRAGGASCGAPRSSMRRGTKRTTGEVWTTGAASVEKSNSKMAVRRVGRLEVGKAKFPAE